MSTAETARRLGVHVATVTRLARKGELEPVVKAKGLRGPYFFDPADVEALAASRATKEATA